MIIVINGILNIKLRMEIKYVNWFCVDIDYFW